MKSIKLFTFIAFFLCSFLSVGQTEYPCVKVIEKDTVIIFTVSQGKELAKQNEERKKLKIDIKILSEQIILKDTVIQTQGRQITGLKKIKIAYDDILKEMDAQNVICEDEKSILKKEIRKQRRGKFASIGVGVLSFGAMLYFYIRK